MYKQQKVNWNFAGCVLLFCAIIYALVMEFFGMEFTDTFFYANRYMTQGHIDFFRPFNQGIYLLSVALCGKTLIAARLINWLSYFLTCIIPLMVVLKHYRDHVAETLLLTSLAIIFIPISETFANNGNGLSCLFLVGAYITFFLRFYKRQLLWLVGTSICVVCGVLSRFPNIVIIPILILVTPMVCQKKNEYIQVLYMLGGSVIIYLLINLCIYGGLKTYYLAYVNTMAEWTDLEASHHTTSSLMAIYLKDLKDMVSYGKFLSLIAIVPLIGYGMRKKGKPNILAILFAISLILFLYTRIGLPCTYTSWRMIMVLNTILLICAFIQCSIGLIRHDWNIFGWGIMPMAFSVGAAAGADAGLMFMAPAWVACLPLIAIQLHHNLKQITSKEVALLICALLGLCFCAALYVRQNMMFLGIIALVILLGALWFAHRIPEQWLQKLPFDNAMGQCTIKRCTWIGFIIIFCMILICKVTHSSDDQPLPNLTAKFSQPQLWGIRSNQTTVDWVNAVMSEYDKVKGQPVIFYGYLSAVFPYLTGEGWIDGMDFTYRENARNLKAFYRAMKQRPIVFLCPINPGARAFYTLDDYPIICTYLLEHSYRCEPHGCYNIYIPE